MNDDTLKRIRSGLLQFKSNISFLSLNSVQSIMDNIFESDPKMRFYIESYSCSTSFGERILHVTYRNTDVKRHEIILVKSFDACIDIFCRSISRFKSRLVLLAPKTVDVDGAYKLFYSELYGFYPNYNGSSWTTYSGIQTSKYSVYDYCFKYRIGNVKLKMMELEVDKEVKRLTKLLFTPDMPDEVKAYLAHNYLASNVEYVKNRKNNLSTSYTQSAYGALIEKKCVCQGYAEAFKRLMDEASIKCDVVVGKCSSEGLHAWNIITINGVRYHVDVTWDGSGSRPGYTYFGKSDAFFVGKRTWNKSFYPRCYASGKLLANAKAYITCNKSRLRQRGIQDLVIDC